MEKYFVLQVIVIELKLRIFHDFHRRGRWKDLKLLLEYLSPVSGVKSTTETFMTCPPLEERK